MSQRYPPPRDRSPPPRHLDRRSSSTYTPLTQSSSYRPGNDNPQPSIDRPPPRGPRAESFRGNFTFSSPARGRGGGFGSRGADTWDRDRERDRDRDRDPRGTTNAFRREDERTDWSRREDRQPPFNRPYAGRERSASPPRARRDSKESISAPFARAQDSGPSYFSGAPRGAGDRGRGRGGWDRSRGRSSFIGERERDLFPNRSRSREGWRDRDLIDRGRNFGPESDRNDRFDRRPYERPFDRDQQPRDHDIWQRDTSPGRNSAGNRAPSPSALSSMSQDRSHKLDYDASRKPLALSSASQARDGRRDPEMDYFSGRSDAARREPSFSQAAPAPPVPQSAPLGLDYGPPPAAATPAAPVVAEKPASSLKPTGPEVRAGPGAFQPPSGPKADRTVSHIPAQPPAPAVQPVEARPKVDGHRTADRQQQQAEAPFRSNAEASKPISDSTDERTGSIVNLSERPLPAHVPSGPRLGSNPSYKTKTSPIFSQSALPPNQVKAMSPEARAFPNAPTGPRSSSILPPSGPRASIPTGPSTAQSGQATSPWARRPQIEHRPTRPSIMNNMNRPHMPDRPPPPAIQQTSKQSPRLGTAQISFTSKEEKATNLQSPVAGSSHILAHVDTPASTDVAMSAPVSEDEESENEPDSELDENYFADSEKIHSREMELLKAKKPALPLEDPAIVNLLVRLQLLGMIVEGIVPSNIQANAEKNDVDMCDEALDGLPSPEYTPPSAHSPKIEHPKPRGRPLKEPAVNPIPTPPIDDLPFLQDRVSNTIVFDDPIEDEVEDEKFTDMLRNEFEHDAWDEKGDLAELKEFYRQKFPEWKYEMDKYEHLRRTLEATPDPGSPGAQSAASLPPSIERPVGRTARNATEFDIEKAILMSQQSAREEEEKREREAAANAKPNYDVEAVVPNMLKPAEREPCWRFQDTNFLVPTHLAVELMQYIPPEDDFTAEEQTKFIAAFCQTPKKWGMIAEQIPGRSYQECIVHYYLTKNEANYKELWRRSQPKRKRGRAATKPRSTALLSDMASNEDGDSTPAPVTDSGRPRRAAAPTFGDTVDSETASLPAAKRLAVTPKDSPDSAPKAAKGRKAGTATKVRRTKAQILADAQATGALANGEGVIKTGPGRARTLAAAKGDTSIPPGMLRAGEIDQQPQTNLPNVVPMRQRTPPPPVVTSYWSVPEQQKFRQLVAYYGHDYAKIADFMKTKSQAMIKNHYMREISKGDVELERIAAQAEEKIARGEPLGPLPSPVAQAKRKYDSTPSMTSRPVTATTETPMESDRAVLTPKAPHVDDFPANAVHRDASGGLVTKPSPRNELLVHSPHTQPAPTKVEDMARERPVLAAKSLQGPHRGLFTHDDTRFPTSLQTRQFPASNDHALHHHPPHVTEVRGGEIASSQTREMPSVSREAISHGQSGSHNAHFRNLDVERSISSIRNAHSRNPSLTGSSQLVDQRVQELSQPEQQRRLVPFGSTQSPRLQPLQATAGPRHDAFPSFSGRIAQPQQHPAQPIKQEQPKPAPKKSDLFGLLNKDEPPPGPMKRSSTDSTNHISNQTPPPPPATIAQGHHPFQARTHEELGGRSSFYPGAHSGNIRNIGELRASYSNSPVPAPRQQEAWLDKFDPRPPGPGVDRTHNQSPSYSVHPPAQPQPSKPTGHGSDGLRMLEPNSSRRYDFGRPQISSPSREVSTPNTQYRPSSAAPQHGRMSSLGFGHGLGPDPQGQQQHMTPHTQGQPHAPTIYQPIATHAPSTSGTPIPSMHRRGDTASELRKLTLEEQRAVSVLDQHRESREHIDTRHAREESMSQRHALPPAAVGPGSDPSRRVLDSRDMYRGEGSNHQVPPPPARAAQYNPSYGQPPRTFTPPAPHYANDPRGIASAHNQHAHQQHHNLGSQQIQHPQQGQNMPQHQHQHQHHQPPPPPQQQQQQQQPIGISSQGRQPLAPHTHQGPPMHQHSQNQYRQDPPRFGQGHLAPPPSHYRTYSSDERR